MIDLHCHLLPGIDDGPEDLQGTIALARAQVAAGVTKVLCTPHVSHGYPANTARTIIDRTRSLRAALDAEGIPLKVQAGAEVAAARARELEDEELARLHLGAGHWLLLEPPLTDELPGIETLVSSLQRRGHEVLLAHPERCAMFHRDSRLLGALVDAGATTQVTASSLTGQFGRTVERFARKMVDEELVHVIASDAHSADRRRPGLAAPLAKAGLEWLTPWACEAVPFAMLAGEAIPEVPAAPAPRRLFGR